MSKAWPFNQQSSLARRNRRLSAAIEGLEPRAYLNGVVFDTPKGTTASTVIAPVYTDLVDLNGDGKADLITANVNNGSVPNSVSILTGNGDGTFDTASAQQFPLSFSPLTIVDGPLNSSGGKLIAVGSTSDPSVEIIIEPTAGTPTYTTQMVTASGLTNTQSVTLGDFFHDGNDDIAVASSTGTTNNIAVFRNTSGTFSLAQVLSVPHTVASITSFALANGTVDLAVADASDNAVTVLTNDGSGSFAVGSSYGVGSEPVTIKAGQFDLASGDTNYDLVTANATGGNVSVLLGAGDGTFNPNAKNSDVSGAAPNGGPLKVRVANVNNDSFPDLIGLLSGGSASDGEVLLGNGDGTFHVGTLLSANTPQQQQTSVAAGDLNADGLTDMVLASTGTVSGLLNITTQDHTPPTATVTGTSSSGVGSSTIQFVVNYSDNTQVDATTLNSSNITVADPNGNAQPVTLVSNNLANGATVSATYSIPAPSGSLSPSDNGQYTVTATSNIANAVKDANGNPLAGGQIGTFTVAVSTNGPNLVAGAVKVKFPATGVVSGVTKTAGASVPVVNSGNALAAGKIVINLYASTSASNITGATQVSTITRNVRLKPGARTAYAFPAFKWPAGLSGSYFLVADVNATNTITETTPADNLGASATAASVAAPFVNLTNLWNGRIPASFKVGRRTALPVLVMNNGNVTARGAGTATVFASTDGTLPGATTLATVPIHVAVAAGHKQTVPVAFAVPSTLASGTYHLIVTINFPGDTNSADDAAVSSGTVTV